MHKYDAGDGLGDGTTTIDLSQIFTDEPPRSVRNTDWRVCLNTNVQMTDDDWAFCSELLFSLMTSFIKVGQPREQLSAELAAGLRKNANSHDASQRILEAFGDLPSEACFTHELVRG